MIDFDWYCPNLCLIWSADAWQEDPEASPKDFQLAAPGHSYWSQGADRARWDCWHNRPWHDSQSGPTQSKTVFQRFTFEAFFRWNIRNILWEYLHVFWICVVCVSSQASKADSSRSQRWKVGGEQWDQQGCCISRRPASGVFSYLPQLDPGVQAQPPTAVASQPPHEQSAQLVTGGGAEEEAQTGLVWPALWGDDKVRLWLRPWPGVWRNLRDRWARVETSKDLLMSSVVVWRWWCAVL